jgi:hypothetical protein
MEQFTKRNRHFKITIYTLIGIFLVYEILTCGGITIRKSQNFYTKEISKKLPNNISLVYAPTVRTYNRSYYCIPLVYTKIAAIPTASIRYDFLVENSVLDIHILDMSINGIKRNDLLKRVSVLVETIPTGQKFITVEIVNIIEFNKQNIAVSGLVIDKQKEETFQMEFDVIPLTEQTKILTGWYYLSRDIYTALGLHPVFFD